MSNRIQRAVMMALLISIAVGTGACLSPLGETCGDGWCPDGFLCTPVDLICVESGCGNTIVEAGEECDDGNDENGDRCDSNCTTTACGNGVVTADEECDDGNLDDEDDCLSTCQLHRCGDGKVDPRAEACDDGNSTSLDGCSADCTLEPLEQEPNEDGTPSVGGETVNGNDFGTLFPDANGAITRSTTIVAALAPAGDEDVFLLRNTSFDPQVITLDTWDSTLGIGTPCGVFDSVLHIRNAAGASLALNDDRSSNADLCSTLVYLLAPGASVYAHVTVFDDKYANTGYVLDIVFRGNTTNGDGCSAGCQIETSSKVEPTTRPPRQ